MEHQKRLEEMEARFLELERQMSDPAVISDADAYRKAAKARADLEPVVARYRDYKQVLHNLEDARLMLEDSDPMLREMAREEVLKLEPQLAEIEKELKILLLPKDPNDEKDVVLEIRAGTGGDEATLFASEVFRMYTRYAEDQRWRVEITSESESSVGGLKEVIALISGNKVYSRMKYESGVHRVQRVPETEQQGRVHTSAITVAVLPEADEVEVKIDPKDIPTALATPPANADAFEAVRPVSVSDALAVITTKMPSALSRTRNLVSDTISVAELKHRVPAAARREADKADNLAGKGRIADCIEHYEKAISIDPDVLVVRLNLGGIYLRSGQPEKAANQFQAAIRIDPQAAGAYAGLATSELWLGDAPAAEKAARRAVRFDGALDVAHYLLGASLAAQKKSAGEIVSHLHKATGRFPAAHLLAARVLAAKGNVTEARGELEEFLVADPDPRDSSVRDWLAGLAPRPSAPGQQ